MKKIVVQPGYTEVEISGEEAAKLELSQEFVQTVSENLGQTSVAKKLLEGYKKVGQAGGTVS